MAEASIDKHKSDRQISEHILNSLNLKTVNNLNEYIVLIVGDHDQGKLLEHFSKFISEDRYKAFNDVKDSLQFIDFMHDKNIFLIISGTLGEIYARIFDNKSEVICLYVYCMDKEKHAKWTEENKKIRCIVSDPTQLVIKLHADIKQLSGRWPFVERSFENIKTITSEWYRFFLLLICRPPPCFEKPYEQMFNECRLYYKNYHYMVNQIDKVKQRLKSDGAIREYTKDSFLYSITNHALRTKSMEIIKKFSPFIADLYSELRKHYCNYVMFQERTIHAVYRGQHLSIEEFDYLRSINKSKSPVILTTFGSASRDPTVGMSFLPDSTNSIRCLFEIIITDECMNEEIYPKDVVRAFADISKLSYFEDEKEVLFSPLTHFCVKDIGDRTVEQDYGWVLITLELIDSRKGNYSYNHPNFVKSIENETNPQNYIDILNFLQEVTENQERFNHITWNKWWSIMEKQWGTHAARDQPLLLTLYQCFTEDKDYSRKAVEMHKNLLRTIPEFQPNRSFSDLLKHFRNCQKMPAKRIAIFEQCLQQFPFTRTKENIECLYDAGLTYENISDKERALECYERILELDQHNEFKKYAEIQRRMEKLKKPSKTDQIVNKKHIDVDQNINKESAKISETNQCQQSNNRNIKSSTIDKLSILNRIQKLEKYIEDLEKWYDATDSKIILPLQSRTNSDFSVNDYRIEFFVAVQKHISSTPNTTDAANNVSLTRWRYKKYIHVWTSFNEMGKVLKTYKKRLEFINALLLPKLERFLKKLTVLIAITIIYLCIEPGSSKINVKKMPSIGLKKAETSELTWFNILDETLLRDLEALPEKTSTTEYASVTIPDDKRFFEVSIADLAASVLEP